MGNQEAVKRIGWIISQMRREAASRHAPVFEAESATENNPFKILVFTVLSARTKDKTTMEAVRRLFREASAP